MTAYRWFKYVLHADRAAYEAAGWVFYADLGPSHGRYSVLMEWPFTDAPPPIERKEADIATNGDD